METMKFYTEEEILDKHIGKKGTPKRDQFEADLNSFLIGEAIKQARKANNGSQRVYQRQHIIKRERPEAAVWVGDEPAFARMIDEHDIHAGR